MHRTHNVETVVVMRDHSVLKFMLKQYMKFKCMHKPLPTFIIYMPFPIITNQSNLSGIHLKIYAFYEFPLTFYREDLKVMSTHYLHSVHWEKIPW